MRILIVEDKERLAIHLQRGLSDLGYAVDWANNGKVAEELVAENEYDLVIMDIMMPESDGITATRNLRRDGYIGPILMLTALASTNDKIRGLDAGADDYLAKPYSFDELAARVRALLRRGNKGENAILRYADVEVDLVHRKVTRGDKEVQLTGKEFSLLEFLIRNAEKPVSRVQIAEHVWDAHFDTESNVIDVYINMLRKKIDSPFASKLVHTLVGVGYVFRK